MNDIYSWQHDLWQALMSRPERLPHALMLKGKQGVGKLDFAKHLAKSLLCEQPAAYAAKPNFACGKCASCRWMDAGGHPDFRLLEPQALSEENATETDEVSEVSSSKAKKKPSKLITVEQIRSLSDLVAMSSHRDGYKIILIHPAEAMNTAAANALLKNLEEPPPKTLFMLMAHQAQRLLPTVRSRCQQIAMPVPDAATAIAWLAAQGVDNAADCLASAGYAPIKALQFNDADYLARHGDFIKKISAPNGFNPIMLAEELHKSDLPTVVIWLQRWCYDMLSVRTSGKIRYHLPLLDTVSKLGNFVEPHALGIYYRSLIAAQRLSRHPLNPRLYLEEILIAYATLMAPARKMIHG